MQASPSGLSSSIRSTYDRGIPPRPAGARLSASHYEFHLPSLQQLLPSVQVETSVLRHIRTLFYSSTVHLQHLANLSVTTSPDSASLTINALLPITPLPSPASGNPALATPTNPNPTIPLLSVLKPNSPPSPRRPTNTLTSLLSLFPPTATCQASPLLQVHIVLPSVRHRLSPAKSMRSAGLALSQTSLTILLTTGQSTNSSGVLLNASTSPKTSIKTITPAPFTASGDVAGVWVRGHDNNQATLALHALAASWWTRRNRRLSRHGPSTPTGDWHERHVHVLRFADSGGDPTVHSGSLWVRDDAGTRFVADVNEAGTTAQFRVVSSVRRAMADTGGRTLGNGWRGGWVAAEDGVGGMEGMDAVKGDGRDQKGSGRKAGTRGGRREASNETAGDISCDTESVTRDDGVWVTERMRPMQFERRDEIGSIGGGEGGGTPQRSEGCTGQEGTSVQADEKIVLRITQSGLVALSDSEGELSGEEELDMDMESLCQKYLQKGYAKEVRRVETQLEGKGVRRGSRR